jgi:hypothetical protein
MRQNYLLKESMYMCGLQQTWVLGIIGSIEASYGRSSLNALTFLKKAPRMCTNKPQVIVDKGPWYP